MASEVQELGAGAPSEALWIVADIFQTEVFCAESNDALLQWQQAWEVVIMGGSNGEAAVAAPAASAEEPSVANGAAGEGHSQEMRPGQPAGLTYPKVWWCHGRSRGMQCNDG
eukprot:scaffold1016_cov258-Pinguiococcus_pyrenoidosus.AAC.22